MSRKDFILIAETIKNLNSDDGICDRSAVAVQFANALQWTNPQFKRDLFIQAATGVVPVNAHKARI